MVVSVSPTVTETDFSIFWIDITRLYFMLKNITSVKHTSHLKYEQLQYIFMLNGSLYKS